MGFEFSVVVSNSSRTVHESLRFRGGHLPNFVPDPPNTMLQHIPKQRELSPSLSSVYAIIATEMKGVDEILAQALSDRVPFVNEVSQYAFHLGGKRLRPAVALMCYKAACGPDGESELPHALKLVAAAIEMIHTASLIHDDILDGALIRRHLPTMHTRWNAGISVMAGDTVFTKALDLVTRLDELEPYKALARACHKTCYGELCQMGTKNRFDLGVDEYVEIVTAKTAALIECGSQMGAYYAGADPATVEQFRLYGREIGIAFQIVDDVLDLVGDEENMGKTLGTDILQQKPTLPVLLYFESLREDERADVIDECAELATDESFVRTIVTRIQASGAVDAAVTYAHKLVDTAVERIRKFAADCPRSAVSQQAVDALCDIAAFVAKREK